MIASMGPPPWAVSPWRDMWVPHSSLHRQCQSQPGTQKCFLKDEEISKQGRKVLLDCEPCLFVSVSITVCDSLQETLLGEQKICDI